MRVIELPSHGGPEVLTLGARDVPIPAYGQVVIQNHYAGVNRPDCLQRAGLYTPPKGASDLPGLESAGVITAVGEGVSQWTVGDEVCALLPGGGYAEYSLTNAAHVLPIPEGIDVASAAALPETFFTVWFNLFIKAKLKAGETVLIHGGTSGIGTTAIMLANAFGARAIVTAGSDDKCAKCLEIGADIAVNYRDEDFVEALKGQKIDVVLDMVGGDYTGRNLKVLGQGGRLVNIAFLQGIKAEVNLALVMAKELVLTGSFLRPQTDLTKARITKGLRTKVWPLIAAGRLAPVMDQTFDLSDASAAHTRMEAGEHIGKIVLKAQA
ncbi:NAD(P)H-quinone oxidoreductase [Amylibacter sp. SFDW26]|uniref:NAD(P)H-quinone oxidoreductase n=1 Tax=Amylibacter sp. SFDW26 TaxID=2652722 RepID=UPI0012625AE3|nr:NAD(P)H-quinone oxidoreductase [Amylibacter sp. SFDW26]KAB7613948.1 NAD(P)H-quinone oxidoreductase [Amylibacter sp. SFDW26]